MTSKNETPVKGPVTPKIFAASWTRRAEFFSVFMTSTEDARFSALRFHPASGWMNSAAEEFPPRFMACDVILPCKRLMMRKCKSRTLDLEWPRGLTTFLFSFESMANIFCSPVFFSFDFALVPVVV